MLNVQHDENERGQANTQTENIHKRSDLISPEDADGDGKERAKHIATLSWRSTMLLALNCGLSIDLFVFQ
jgi:hypothetical protein